MIDRDRAYPNHLTMLRETKRLCVTKGKIKKKLVCALFGILKILQEDELCVMRAIKAFLKQKGFVGNKDEKL